ncbi:MAG: alkaline phosphatase family protein [Vicinamibacterales bacterium]
MTPRRSFASLLALLAGLAAVSTASGQASSQAGPGAQANRVVLIVVDGLRPDQVTAAVMPRLHALGARGITFDAHHAAVPTVTRVNAPTMATGSYPETHGILGNTVYAPHTFPTRGVNTASHADLEAMATGEGALLTTPSLAQILDAAGRRLAVYSAGSSGSALLLVHPLPGSTIVVNPELVRPASLATAVTAAVGAGPAESVPNTARNHWMVEAWRTLAPTAPADLTIFWFADPDETAHAKGLGTPDTNAALGGVDAEIGRIEDTLRTRRELDTTTLLVASDHGFSTHTGELKLAALVAPFARPLADGSPDLIVTEGAITARQPLPDDRLRALVAALQARPEVGAIFTPARRAGDTEGMVPGTLATSIAHWQHARSGAVLVSGNWTPATNAHGVPGTTTQTGTAGHGTTSPFDIHNTFLAAGRGVRRSAHGVAPTSNADLAPTILTLLGVPVPASMTGRVVRELLAAGPAPQRLAVTHRTIRVATDGGRYEAIAEISTVDGRDYLDRTEVHRRP